METWFYEFRCFNMATGLNMRVTISHETANAEDGIDYTERMLKKSIGPDWEVSYADCHS